MRFKHTRGFLLIAICLLGANTSQVRGQSVTIDHVDGARDANSIYAETPITFHIRMNAGGGSHTGLTNGFRIWSPGPFSAQWNTTTATLTGALKEPDDFDLVYQAAVRPIGGPHGTGADTVAYAAAAMFSDGMPADFDDIPLTITVGPIDDYYIGSEICIDSSFYPRYCQELWIGYLSVSS